MTEVNFMDVTVIIAVVIGVLFIAGGLIASHYGSKVSESMEEEARNQKNKV